MLSQALEGGNAQARIPRQRRFAEKLTLQLKRGLLRCQKEQRRTFGRFLQCRARFRQAAEGLPRPRRPEPKTHLHALDFARDGSRRKEANPGQGRTLAGSLLMRATLREGALPMHVPLLGAGRARPAIGGSKETVAGRAVRSRQKQGETRGRAVPAPQRLWGNTVVRRLTNRFFSVCP